LRITLVEEEDDGEGDVLKRTLVLVLLVVVVDPLLLIDTERRLKRDALLLLLLIIIIVIVVESEMTLEMDKEKDFRGVKWRACSMRGTDSILRIFFCLLLVSWWCGQKEAERFFIALSPRKGGDLSSSLLLFFSSLDTPCTNKENKKKIGLLVSKKKTYRERDACAYPILCSRLSASRREKREREKERVKIIESVRIGVHGERERERERESRK